MRSITILIGLCSMLVLVSCGKKKETTGTAQDGPGYFSIMQFAQDQFHNFWGQPYTLQRFETRKGQTDSSYISIFLMPWGEVLKPFFDADISDPKYVGKYKFSSFEDPVSDSKTYYYEANDKKLFTRSMQIVTNVFTSKITSIYIETNDDGRVRKLLYKPIKLIQIQEFESSMMGGKKELRTEYRFL